MTDNEVMRIHILAYLKLCELLSTNLLIIVRRKNINSTTMMFSNQILALSVLRFDRGPCLLPVNGR